eukprot:scaffold652_cov260-Pinguiococcus_pyrenoidosus.AAC.13
MRTGRVKVRRAWAQGPREGLIGAGGHAHGALPVGLEDEPHGAGISYLLLGARLRRTGVAGREAAERPGALQISRVLVPAVVAGDVSAELRFPGDEPREDRVFNTLRPFQAQPHLLHEEPKKPLQRVCPAEGPSPCSFLLGNCRRHSRLAKVDHGIVKPNAIALRGRLVDPRVRKVPELELGLAGRAFVLGADENIAHAEADVVIPSNKRRVRAVERASRHDQRLVELVVHPAVHLRGLQAAGFLLLFRSGIEHMEDAAHQLLRVLPLPRGRLREAALERLGQRLGVRSDGAVGRIFQAERLGHRRPQGLHLLLHRSGAPKHWQHQCLSQRRTREQDAEVPNLLRPKGQSRQSVSAAQLQGRSGAQAAELHFPRLRRHDGTCHRPTHAAAARGPDLPIEREDLRPRDAENSRAKNECARHSAREAKTPQSLQKLLTKLPLTRESQGHRGEDRESGRYCSPEAAASPSTHEARG